MSTGHPRVWIFLQVWLRGDASSMDDERPVARGREQHFQVQSTGHISIKRDNRRHSIQLPHRHLLQRALHISSGAATKKPSERDERHWNSGDSRVQSGRHPHSSALASVPVPPVRRGGNIRSLSGVYRTPELCSARRHGHVPSPSLLASRDWGKACCAWKRELHRCDCYSCSVWSDATDHVHQHLHHLRHELASYPVQHCSDRFVQSVEHSWFSPWIAQSFNLAVDYYRYNSVS